MIATDRLMEPFLKGNSSFAHGYTFGGHPVSTAVAMANLDIFEAEGINKHVLANEGAFRTTLERLGDLPIVGDVRGAGFFYAIELVKDKEKRTTFDADECERLLHGYLSQALFDAGLICRADDRGDPVVQISPPLVAREEEMDEIVRILGDVLEEAQHRI
jgi:adenosylmethionine-8-amino-7-oxononanoate aminotransferase